MAGVWFYVENRKEKERRNSQVKIWMQSANGITQALQRVIANKWQNLYSSVQDVVNSVHAVDASAFALYQSLYEERVLTEEEYKKDQKEMRAKIKNEQERLEKEAKKSPQPASRSTGTS